ncbi:helix-turn-helix transcriptional regulator [Novosphingobium sediminis]|uniref:helix-turn-helix transcriptional regulator n=1 Tax=Novosphingobium sediminis TaxID=707214 RepID=UPI001C3F80DD|nr:AlpA family phage regulatory protein [Novosphingobium sediminis]
MTMPILPWSPYLGQTDVPSLRRITLTTAFARLIQVTPGFQPHELIEIFEAPEDQGENDLAREMVRLTGTQLAREFLRGGIATFARPLGGGEIIEIPAAHWEIDDALPRFATGAYATNDWANAGAVPTHRIFVDEHQYDRWLVATPPDGHLSKRECEVAFDPYLRTARAIVARAANQDVTASVSIEPAQPAAPAGTGPELLLIAEVSSLVALRPSTIYKKLQEGDFPQQIKLGSRAVWSKPEVLAWVRGKAALRAS